MHSATLLRMARLCGQPQGRRPFLHCRVAMGIFVLGSALLINTHALYAQSESGAADSIVPRIVLLPGDDDALSVVPVADAVGTPTDIIHEIVAGDTLTNVAQRYNVEPANLATYNQILDQNNVIIGQKLRIPPVGVTITEAAEVAVPGADGYHVVRMGESLSAIAKMYNMTLDELMALNEIENPNIVQMGMMLRLVEGVESPEKAIQPELMVITHKIKRGETLAEIAQQYYTTVAQILADNQITDAEPKVKVGQELQIFPPATALQAFGIDAPIDGERKIVIDLSDQSLTAYQGDVVVLHTIVSTGKAATPTRVGEFATYLKYKSQHMSGEDYDLPGVPWVMYYDDEYAIHGAYWHANFGIPTSHGCTNMTIPESKALYTWAPMGTRVIVEE